MCESFNKMRDALQRIGSDTADSFSESAPPLVATNSDNSVWYSVLDGCQGAKWSGAADSLPSQRPIGSATFSATSRNARDQCTVGTGLLPPRRPRGLYPFDRLKPPRGEEYDFFDWEDVEGKTASRLRAAIATRSKKYGGRYRLQRHSDNWRVYRIG